MPRDRIDVDGGVRRSADCRICNDRVLERLARKNIRRLQILFDDLDCAHAGFIGDLRAFAIGRGDRGAAGQRHAERFGECIHRRGGTHRVAVADRRRRRSGDLHEFIGVDSASRHVLACFPDCGAGAGALALPPAVEHRSAGENDSRRVHGRRGHQAGGRCLVAAGHQHDAVERVAVKDFDKPEISEVAVKRGRWTLARLLDRVTRKLKGDAARCADSLAHALGELEMVAVAGRQVRTGLRDADDRFSRPQLHRRQAIIEIALEVERSHARVIGVVEPELGPQASLGF